MDNPRAIYFLMVTQKRWLSQGNRRSEFQLVPRSLNVGKLSAKSTENANDFGIFGVILG
jgi:hypothetical protein